MVTVYRRYMAPTPEDFPDARCPVNVYTEAFIPHDRIEPPVPAPGDIDIPYHAFDGDGAGRGYEKGLSARMYTSVTVDVCAEDPLLDDPEHGTGETVGYEWEWETLDASPWVTYREVSETGKASTEDMSATVTKVDDCTVQVEIDAAAAMPLISGAPDIDYHYSIELSCSKDDVVEYEMAGYHDGYPAYAIYIGKETVYKFDETDEQTKMSLFGYGEWDLEDTAKTQDTTPVESCDCGGLASTKIRGPDFESHDEVVEITNLGSETTNLADWTISDTTGHTVRFARSASLGAGETARVSLQSDSRLAQTLGGPMLNDEEGDTVSLSSHTGETLSQFSYAVEERDRAALDETYYVFENTTEESDESHWVEYDCGHRPDGEHRSGPFPGVPTCGHCHSWTRRDVTVTQSWTELSGDGEGPALNRSAETTLEDVEDGEFYDRWGSKS